MLGKFKQKRLNEFRERYWQRYYEASQKGLLIAFDNKFYHRFDDKYLNGIPVAALIRYFKADKTDQQECLKRSILLSHGFPTDAAVMCGRQKLTGIEYYWVEYDGWCYDAIILAAVERKTYYRLMELHDIGEEIEGVVRFRDRNYRKVYYGSISDYLPYGPRRSELASIGAIIESNNSLFFRAEMNAFLASIRCYRYYRGNT